MTIYRDVCQLFLTDKDNMKSYFAANKIRVCLTTDTWTSIQNYNYMVVTAHFVDHHWKLHKRIICFCLIESHEGKHIGKALEKCLIDWGLEKVFTVTLDNASANKVVIDYLRKKVVTWGSSLAGAKHLHVICAAHILALVVKDGMKKYHTSLLRIRAVVKYVTKSPARLKKFTAAAVLERIDCKKGLILDVKTRWNSTYLMLVAAERYEKDFERQRESDRAFREKFCFDIPVPRNVMGDGDETVDLDVDYDLDSDDEEPDIDEEEEDVAAAALRKTKKKNRPKVHAPERYDWCNARVLI
ncbi:hypothetical protein MKX03_027053 [Papaver bracteatum]|nr:hypothetical protein MKX03_027053 [Papaver bracteatum]